MNQRAFPIQAAEYRMAIVLILYLFLPVGVFAENRIPTVKVGDFLIETRKIADAADGFPEAKPLALTITKDETVYAGTSQGLVRLRQGKWEKIEKAFGDEVRFLTSRDNQVWYTYQGYLCSLQAGVVAQLVPLPKNMALFDMKVSADGVNIFLATEEGLYSFQGSEWKKDNGLADILAGKSAVRGVALGKKGEISVASEVGLFSRFLDGQWREQKPRQGNRSWAPIDVRGTVYDQEGRLWFAAPQGVGCLSGTEWRLYMGQDGLPYNDFTTIAGGETGVVWLGTKRGAIRFDGRNWEYRQGRRWIPGDEIVALAVDRRGNAWLATADGLACIERRPTTLKQKADYYEKEIDLRHRRTNYGYVLGVSLPKQGDKSNWVQHDSDNDGLWTSMYGAGECYAFAATGKEGYRQKAKAAFEALQFLGQVTQGGSHPAPKGFVARTVLPVTAGDPNKTAYTKEKDERTRAVRDRLWKILSPRWPLSADGQWYWKSDTSSDELDGHYFFYARYFDLVAKTEAERRAVQDHVRALTDHLIDHNFTLTDWDGKPTRWAVFNPEALNQDLAWWEERGMNSLSMLSYLKTAAHITKDNKYELAAKYLIEKHGYAANAQNYKSNAGPGSGNQSDDEMSFMCLYNLLLYEQDPVLVQRYAMSLYTRWIMEQYELCPLFNFLAAAVLEGKSFADSHGSEDLTPSGAWLEESLDTLKRFPLELIDWRLNNSHRIDIVPLPDYAGDGKGSSGRGARCNGKVLPVDERFVDHWNHDPWRLNQGGEGRYLADGAGFLLPYYMGLYHQLYEE